MILKELSHKRKTVADLIRFIGNTSENHEVTRIKAPNYSVLLVLQLLLGYGLVKILLTYGKMRFIKRVIKLQR